MKNLLVTGANGQLGHYVRAALAKVASAADVQYATHNELNLASTKSISSFFENHTRFRLIINLAAYTQVDRAESERDLAWQVNVNAPAELAKYCDQFIHISTDYVFDGEKRTPYDEGDQPKPLSHYGLTKLEGEKRLLETHSNAMIIRTSWLYSMRPGNFLTKITQLARERSELRIVNDQWGTPTYARDLAELLARIASDRVLPGVLHYSGEGETTWYEFARYFLEKQGIRTPVVPIPTVEFPTPAKRPLYSVLNKAKIKREWNAQVPHWQEAVDACLSEGTSA